MPTLFTNLIDDWDHTAARLDRHPTTLRRWQAAEPALAGLDSIAALVATCHDKADVVRSHAAFDAVCRLAATDEAAELAAVRLVLPGLAGVVSSRAVQRGRRWALVDRDEAESIVVAATVFRLRHPRPIGTKAAPRLVSYASWRLRQAIEDATDDASLDDLPPGHEPASRDPRTVVELLGTALVLAVRSGQLPVESARLLYRSTILAQDQKQLARDQHASRRQVQAMRRAAAGAVTDWHLAA